MVSAEAFRCRSCGAPGSRPVLSLGSVPLANALLRADQLDRPEAAYPLDLVFCPGCTLVQITETVPPGELFADYPYFSSYSDTTVKNAEALAHRLTAQRALGEGSLVVEVGSNDGYLLRHYRNMGIPVLGIDPARNVAEQASRRHGIPMLCDFFSLELARGLAAQGRRAQVIHANHVLAHVPDPNGVAAGIAALLDDDGVAVIEVPYLRDLIQNVEFDTIYHEHLCYFSLTALDHLFRRNGAAIVDCEQLPVHGGCLRLFVARGEGLEASAAVEDLLAEETEQGLCAPAYYESFAGRVKALRSELCSLLGRLRSQGRRIAAYGASAKGTTLLNYFGIGSDVLEFVADRSEVKQGLFTPGTHLPVVAPEALLREMPDYVLLLTWNFREEILVQQAEYARCGGRFIVPIPRLEVV